MYFPGLPFYYDYIYFSKNAALDIKYNNIFKFEEPQ